MWFLPPRSRGGLPRWKERGVGNYVCLLERKLALTRVFPIQFDCEKHTSASGFYHRVQEGICHVEMIVVLVIMFACLNGNWWWAQGLLKLKYESWATHKCKWLLPPRPRGNSPRRNDRGVGSCVCLAWFAEQNTAGSKRKFTSWLASIELRFSETKKRMPFLSDSWVTKAKSALHASTFEL